ncbi:MAG: ThuA domain-containing protein [Clostridia bacterium]|nr:ThuA domain-containing protein [Clostridia bacterium]
MINLTVWNEDGCAQNEEVAKVYPDGINAYLAEMFGAESDMNVTKACLDDPECGLPDEVLENTDVLIWWGHCKHERVPDELVAKIHDRVLRGMGLIVLHSGHYSKIFKSLMGTTCSLSWRDGDRERLWNIAPNHQITQGIGDNIVLDVEEMYGERFDIPEPDETIFLGWFSGGEVFRSGCCWNRGLGKVFYFQPGHESNPTYKNKDIQTVLKNAVRWAAPYSIRKEPIDAPHVPVSPEEEYAKSKA